MIMVLVISHEGNRDILILVESIILKVKQITGLYHEAQNIYILTFHSGCWATTG